METKQVDVAACHDYFPWPGRLSDMDASEEQILSLDEQSDGSVPQGHR